MNSSCYSPTVVSTPDGNYYIIVIGGIMSVFGLQQLNYFK